jgi:glycine hydroxymethyltransferase
MAQGPGAEPTRPAGDELRAPLAEVDPELAELLAGELDRQRTTLDLVASESVPPRAVLEAQGSHLTAKYADGYPGSRHYDSCGFVDEIERLAIERAKALFCADHANVQPYSGSSANAAVLHALCEPGDVVLGWDFAHGGHPTHHAGECFTGHFYSPATYGVRREDRLVDMDQVAEAADRLRPKVVIAGWSCYSRWLDFRRFREICDEVGAYLLVDMAHFAGLVAAGLHPDPVPYADACTMTVHKTLGGARGGTILCREELAERVDAAVYPGEQGCPLPHVIAAKAASFQIAGTEAFRERMGRTVAGAQAIAAALVAAADSTGSAVVTGGTDVHQLTVDLEPSGREAPAVMAALNGIGISANAMRLAFDESPSGSGMRLGAAAPAARGFGSGEFAEVGGILAEALALAPGSPDGSRTAAGDPLVAAGLRERVRALLEGFPLYPYL